MSPACKDVIDSLHQLGQGEKQELREPMVVTDICSFVCCLLPALSWCTARLQAHTEKEGRARIAQGCPAALAASRLLQILFPPYGLHASRFHFEHTMLAEVLRYKCSWFQEL